MRYSTIACLDDLTRDGDVPLHECLYDLVRAPIWHAAGRDIARSPRPGQRHALAPGFRAEDFLAACDWPRRPWHALHHAVPTAAAALLAAAVPPRALALGHQMPPWLRTALDAAGCPWVDIRLSPLDFGADTYLELRFSGAELEALAAPFGLSAEALFTDACQRMATVRHARRAAAPSERWDDALVFVPQADEDPALLAPDGRFARLEDHAAALRHLAGQRRLVCLEGHPAQHQRLARLLGRDVPLCPLELDTLLAMDDDVAFVGLQVPALAQAAWFGKEAVALVEHADPGPAAVTVPAHAFLSEPLWAALLTGAPPRPGAVQIAPMADTLRRALGRATVAPTLASSEALPDPMPEGLDPLDIERQRVDALRIEINGLKDALRLLMRQTALHQAREAPVTA